MFKNRSFDPIKKIYAFWESEEEIPAYLKLCKETWKRNIPQCEVHIINYQNIHEYIGDTYDLKKLKTIPLAMQSDIISAAVLERFGGLFLDIDCIVTDDVFEIFNMISKDRLIAFGRPNAFSIHLAVLYSAQPNNILMKKWREEAQKRLDNKPEKIRWDYFGNAIINPLLKEKSYRNSFYIIERAVSGNILESSVFIESKSPNAISNYINFYFNEYIETSSKVLELVNCGVISLHNSWTPKKYKDMKDIEAFKKEKINLSKVLNIALKKDNGSVLKNTLPIIDSFLKSGLDAESIDYKSKYIGNLLVLDFNINQSMFAFDISVRGNNFIVDIVLRNIDKNKLKNNNLFKDLAFNKNKSTILATENRDDVLSLVISFYKAIAEIIILDYQVFLDSLTNNEAYIELKSIDINDAVLFIDGIGFLSGISVDSYRDIDYKLILRGEEDHIIQLAKAYRPEITDFFSKENGISYDYCWFTTLRYAGVNLKGIPNGKYRLSVIIESKGIKEEKELLAKKNVVLNNSDFLDFVDKGNDLVEIKYITIDKSTVNILQPVKSSNANMKIVNSFIDDDGNELKIFESMENCFIRFLGKNNKVEINSKLNNVSIEALGNSCNVKVGKNVKISGKIRLGFNCQVTIGDNVSSSNPVYITCAEGSKVTIGKDCMFATNNQIRTDDAHPIYDTSTGERINFSKDVIIGDHVWVGYGATLLGGTDIGSGTVIGANSIVNKKFPNNCVIVGSPAKIVRKDIFWERSPLLLRSENVLSFSEDELKKKTYCSYTQL